MKNIVFLYALLVCKIGMAQLTLVKDFYPGSESSQPVILGALDTNKIIVTTYRDFNWRDLWVTDGTSKGTFLIDSNLFSHEWNTGPVSLLHNNKLYFIGNDNYVHGQELWVTDGTKPGTYMIKDICKNGCNAFEGYVSSFGPTSELVSFNGKIYFPATDGIHGTELWESDGTTAGTKMVTDLYPGNNGSKPMFLISAFGKLYFAAIDHLAEYYPIKWWCTDGTPAGTKVLDGQRFTGNIMEPMTLLNGKGYFQCDNSLAYTDGKAVKMMFHEAQLDDPIWLMQVANKIFFRAGGPLSMYELWATDGTDTGTSMVKDIVPGINGSGPYQLTPLKDRLIFSATTDSNGTELWSSDGTDTGTFMIKDINAGVGKGHDIIASERHATHHMFRIMNRYYTYKDRYYFSGCEDSTDTHLWVTDGTDTGTRLLERINPSGSSRIFWIGIHFGKIWVSGTDGMNGLELYTYQLPIDTPVSVAKSISRAKQLLVYPNPNNGEFTLQLGRDFTNGDLTIFDITGRIIYSQGLDRRNKHLPIRLETPKGVYILSVKLDGYITNEILKIGY